MYFFSPLALCVRQNRSSVSRIRIFSNITCPGTTSTACRNIYRNNLTFLFSHIGLFRCSKLVTRSTSSPSLSRPSFDDVIIAFYAENVGLNSTQTLATLFDGIARHSPEGTFIFSYYCLHA